MRSEPKAPRLISLGTLSPILWSMPTSAKRRSRFGDYVAKLGAFPASAAQDELRDWQLDAKDDEDGFRHATVEFFRGHEAVFELRAQLWTNAETQPIEDASVDWPTAGK